MRQARTGRGSPLFRTRREDVTQAGVELLPRLVESQDDIPHAEDGCVVAVDGVVWATGFRPHYDWIKLPIFDPRGRPTHDRGIVASAPGLYFVGLPFQSGVASMLLGGVGSDAKFITGQIR